MTKSFLLLLMERWVVSAEVLRLVMGKFFIVLVKMSVFDDSSC